MRDGTKFLPMSNEAATNEIKPHPISLSHTHVRENRLQYFLS